MWFYLEESRKTKMSETSQDLHESLKTIRGKGYFSQTYGDPESYHPSQKVQKEIDKWKKKKNKVR